MLKLSWSQMMTHKELPKPPSLTQLFNAPDDYRGIFGLCCGYSADSEFLDNAMERFTGDTRARRAYEGKISLQLVLDPAHPQINFTNVPGLYHVPLRSDANKPFRLMHAKVALLGFQHQTDKNKWRIRLIVSTGNWTRQTLEESLDLAWWIEVDSEEFAALKNSDLMQRFADIGSAWKLFGFLQEYYQPRLSENNIELQKLKIWLGLIDANKGSTKARFFDNRKTSFLAQLPVRVDALLDGKTPNYLAMGSGFFEGNVGAGQVPAVLNDIVTTLKDKRCLTSSSEIDVYVNHNACQGVSEAFNSMRKLGWGIKRAYQPDFYGNEIRSLHAKFLFSAYERSDSLGCLNPWIYMGSGNLSKPGFRQKMSSKGNLEAAVLFAPEELYWRQRQKIAPEKVVTNLLPIHWDDEIEHQDNLLSGGEMPERGEEFLSAPVTSLVWSEANDGGWLTAESDLPTDLKVIDFSEKACEFYKGSGFRWRDTRPRQVEVQWKKGDSVHSAFIAVIDELGRIAATELPELDIEQAWLQLMTFPSPPEDEDLPNDGEFNGDGGDIGTGSTKDSPEKSKYAIRRMMELIENIAQKQTNMSEIEWPYWCSRLEQTLIQSAGCSIVEKFKELGVNPLTPLKEKPFRPDFSLTNDKEKERYESVLERVSEKWEVSQLKSIGGEL
jgi:hypothetical protein